MESPVLPSIIDPGKEETGTIKQERRNEKGRHNNLSWSQLGFSKIESASL